MSLKSTITTTLGRQLLHAQKHSPVLMLGAGIIGFGATVVMSCKATLKLNGILDEGKKKLDEVADETDENKKKRSRIQLSTAIEVAKIYAVPAALGIASLALITGSHRTLSTRNAGLAAAYAALDKGFREYRGRVISELGAEKDAQFRYDLVETEGVEETDEGPVPITILKAARDRGVSIYAKYFDDTNPNWRPSPNMNEWFLMNKQLWANQLLKARGHVFLSEVYDMLGYDRTPESTQVGWIYNPDFNATGDNEIDFGVMRDSYIGQEFINGDEKSILLDFNVDGVIWNLIGPSNQDIRPVA